jgi:hypothetical protein
MRTEYAEIADWLKRCFADLSERVEACILAQMISGGDSYYSYRFEVDVLTLQGLGEILRADAPLWADFRRVVLDFRASLHWTKLLEHVYEVGNLEGKVKFLGQGLSCPSAEDRRRLAAHLNCLDGEIGFCRELADRRNLAGRISRAAGFPLIDGLSLRGLAYVLGEHADLWHDFRSLVECANQTERSRQPLNDAQP